MNLFNLQEMAKKVLETSIPVEGFENIPFSLSSGGIPTNKCGVPEVSRSSSFRYSTTANGDAYRGEIVVCCLKTNLKDAKDRAIYITPKGQCFVFSYFPGDPSSFDGGSLRDPLMEIPK